MRFLRALWVLLVLAALVFVASNGVKALEGPKEAASEVYLEFDQFSDYQAVGLIGKLAVTGLDPDIAMRAVLTAYGDPVVYLTGFEFSGRHAFDGLPPLALEAYVPRPGLMGKWGRASVEFDNASVGLRYHDNYGNPNGHLGLFLRYGFADETGFRAKFTLNGMFNNLEYWDNTLIGPGWSWVDYSIELPLRFGFVRLDGEVPLTCGGCRVTLDLNLGARF